MNVSLPSRTVHFAGAVSAEHNRLQRFANAAFESEKHSAASYTIEAAYSDAKPAAYVLTTQHNTLRKVPTHISNLQSTLAKVHVADAQ